MAHSFIVVLSATVDHSENVVHSFLMVHSALMILSTDSDSLVLNDALNGSGSLALHGALTTRGSLFISGALLDFGYFIGQFGGLISSTWPKCVNTYGLGGSFLKVML